MGTITGAQRSGGSIVLKIRPDVAKYDVAEGGSVAVDGCCLTLEKYERDEMRFSAVAETLSKTTLDRATAGRRVNLERAAVFGGRIDGHFVYGHVDAIARITEDREANGSVLRTLSVPQHLARFMALKGSVALDGISLTIAACTDAGITVSLIPHTLSMTTLTLKRPGDTVNLECDIIARYLDRLMTHSPGTATKPQGEELLSLMERAGF